MLPFFSGFFIGGLILGAYLPFLPLGIIALLIVVAVVLTACERQCKLTVAHGVTMYACLLGGLLYASVTGAVADLPMLPSLNDREAVRVTGRVIAPVQHSPHRQVVLIDISSLATDTQQVVSGLLRLTWHEPDIQLLRGDRVETTVRLREPFGTSNPGGFHYGEYLKQKGVRAVGFVSGAGRVRLVEPGSAWDPLRIIDGWRNAVRQAAIASLDGSALGIFLGVVIGEQHFIASEIRDQFMATGTVHILSISGTHLGLFAVVCFSLVKMLCGRMPAAWLEQMSRKITPKQLSALLTAPLVVFYTGLAGAEVPTVRSLIMILVFLLAIWLGRERQLIRALSLAALVILIHDPRAVFDVSFQLSFVAVLAIAMAIKERSPQKQDEPPATSWRVQGGEWVRQYLRMTVAVTLATLPLVGLSFNQVAWLGVFANAVIVPFVGLLVVPLGLGSAVLSILVGSESLPLADFNQLALDTLVSVNGWLASVPYAEWHIASPAILTIVLYYALLAGLVWTRARSAVRWTCAVGVIVIVIGWVWSPRWNWAPGTLRVTFLDVSQGDATVIELPNGQTLLVDGGRAFERWNFGRMVVGPFLWDRGIRRLDHVIATHPQIDHVGGLEWVVEKFQVDHFWSNGVPRDNRFYQDLRRRVRQAGLTEQVAARGVDIVRDEQCRVAVLHPPPVSNGDRPHAIQTRDGTELNNLSVVMEIRCGKHAVLLTADVESDALTAFMSREGTAQAEVVKIPHHGAVSSYHPGWIANLQAKVAVVSAGPHNPYSHPVPRVLEAYERKGMNVFRTDRDGAVWVQARPSSPAFEVHTTAEQKLVPVTIGKSLLPVEIQNWKRLWRLWTGQD